VGENRGRERGVAAESFDEVLGSVHSNRGPPASILGNLATIAGEAKDVPDAFVEAAPSLVALEGSDTQCGTADAAFTSPGAATKGQ
jgi:hypothetical protein